MREQHDAQGVARTTIDKEIAGRRDD